MTPTPLYALSLTAEEMRLLHIAYAIGVLMLEEDYQGAREYAEVATLKLSLENPRYRMSINQITQAMIAQSLDMHETPVD